MTDSSNTFREIAQKALEESTVTEESEVDAKPEAPAVVPEKAPEQPSLEQTEETFTSKGELKGKTAEELEQIWKDWNKAYTQKRQTETSELKTLREERDQLQQRLQALETKTQANPQQAAQDYQGEQDELFILLQQGQISPAEFYQRLQAVIDSKSRAAAREEYETLASQEQQKAEEARQQTALEEVNALDPRFNSELGDTYDKAMHRSILADVGEALDTYIAEHGNSIGFDHKGVAQQLIADWNARIDAEVKRRTQQSTQVARDAAGKFAKQNPKGSPAPSVSTEGKSLREILAQKLEEQA